MFFSEQVYETKGFWLGEVNSTVNGEFIVYEFENYKEFILDKYNDVGVVSNSLPNVYISAESMSADKRSVAQLAVLEPFSRLHPIQIKIRGGYGRASPKKSYSVRFLQDVELFGVAGKTLYLQGQFNDPLLNRNVVSLGLFEALGYPVVKNTFVNVFFSA